MEKELPGVFPERLRLSDVDLVVRNRPHDFVMEDVDLDLNPSGTGELRMGKLQLPTTQAWSKLAAPASYTNRTLVVRDLVLSNEERVRMLSLDASQIDKKTLPSQHRFRGWWWKTLRIRDVGRSSAVAGARGWIARAKCFRGGAE